MLFFFNFVPILLCYIFSYVFVVFCLTMCTTSVSMSNQFANIVKLILTITINYYTWEMIAATGSIIQVFDMVPILRLSNCCIFYTTSIVKKNTVTLHIISPEAENKYKTPVQYQKVNNPNSITHDRIQDRRSPKFKNFQTLYQSRILFPN